MIWCTGHAMPLDPLSQQIEHAQQAGNETLVGLLKDLQRRKLKETPPPLPPCNACGGDLIPAGAGYPEGIVNLTVKGGYGSRVLQHLTAYRFSMCETCLMALFHTFKVPVMMWDTLVDGTPENAPRPLGSGPPALPEDDEEEIDAMYCEHANEVPMTCPCPPNCFCRVRGSCVNRPCPPNCACRTQGEPCKYR